MQPSLNEERLLTVGQGSHQSTVGPKTSIALQNCLFTLIKTSQIFYLQCSSPVLELIWEKFWKYHSSSSAAEPLRHLLMQPEVALSRSSKDFRKEDSSRAHRTDFKI